MVEVVWNYYIRFFVRMVLDNTEKMLQINNDPFKNEGEDEGNFEESIISWSGGIRGKVLICYSDNIVTLQLDISGG
jgi:hypothetical protein